MLRSDGAYVQSEYHFGFRFLESMTAKLKNANQTKHLVILRTLTRHI